MCAESQKTATAQINHHCPYCGKQLKSQDFIMHNRFGLKNSERGFRPQREDGDVVPLFPIIFVACTVKSKCSKRSVCVCVCVCVCEYVCVKQGVCMLCVCVCM